MIRKGDVVGYLVDPQEFFDVPGSEAEFEKLARSAQAIAAIIAISSEKMQGETSQNSEPPEDNIVRENPKRLRPLVPKQQNYQTSRHIPLKRWRSC